MPTVKFDDPFCVRVQPGRVFEDRGPRDVALHLVLKLPNLRNLGLLRAEHLNVLFHLLAEKDFLQTDQSPILERQLFVLEESVEVGSELRLLELQQRVRRLCHRVLIARHSILLLLLLPFLDELGV